MKNTRNLIFEQVLLLQNATISQLSEILAISEISIRHHLMSLEADGIITSTEERHGVGRPRFVYRLTEKGFQDIPADHFRLSDQTLSTMKNFLSPDTFLELLKQIGRDLAEGYKSLLSSGDHDQILTHLSRSLTQDGFILSRTRSDESYILTLHHCPFRHLGQKHPEVCTINQALIESLFEKKISRHTCILRGDAACTYIFEVEDGK